MYNLDKEERNYSTYIQASSHHTVFKEGVRRQDIDTARYKLDSLKEVKYCTEVSH
jgi:hypothetical protein